MSEEKTGFTDSHFIWKVSTDGGSSYKKVKGLISLAIPDTAKVTDDITPTDATNPHLEVVNFTEADSIEFEMVLDPSDDTHIALEQAKDGLAVIKSQIHFVDTRVKGFEFECKVSKFTYDSSDVKKKMRINGTLTYQGDIKRIVSNPAG